MTTSHTPGPWSIRPTETGYQVEHAADGIRSIIAECHTVSVCDEHGDAANNARLITAAPELLNALIAAVGCMEDSLAPGMESQLEAIRQARAAIAKAR